MINLVILQGNITSKGIEKHETNSGMIIAKFTLHYSEKYKDEWRNSFFDCVVFGKTAEMICEYFDAGSPMNIEGKLNQEQWEDNEGNKRSKISVTVNRVHFPLRDKGEATSEAPAAKSATKSASSKKSKDEDIPF